LALKPGASSKINPPMTQGLEESKGRKRWLFWPIPVLMRIPYPITERSHIGILVFLLKEK
jgi:hypothetical protein